MSFKFVDMDGEEMPIAKPAFSYEELDTIFRVVDEIFAHLDTDKGVPVFAAPVQVDRFMNKDVASTLLKQKESKYKNIKLYEINGTIIFDVRGPSGGVVTNQLFYLMKTP